MAPTGDAAPAKVKKAVKVPKYLTDPNECRVDNVTPDTLVSLGKVIYFAKYENDPISQKCVDNYHDLIAKTENPKIKSYLEQFEWTAIDIADGRKNVYDWYGNEEFKAKEDYSTADKMAMQARDNITGDIDKTKELLEAGVTRGLPAFMTWGFAAVLEYYDRLPDIPWLKEILAAGALGLAHLAISKYGRTTVEKANTKYNDAHKKARTEKDKTIDARWKDRNLRLYKGYVEAEEKIEELYENTFGAAANKGKLEAAKEKTEQRRVKMNKLEEDLAKSPGAYATSSGLLSRLRD
jgi:hypothetical protein